jgi:hypothetical protein
MVNLETAKEIVEKLRSGKYGLLTLTKEYKIPPRQIVELPEFIEIEEKRKAIKEKLNFEQEKELLLGKIDHKLYLLKKALKEDSSSRFAEYCRGYIRALKNLSQKIEKCDDEEEFIVLMDLVQNYFEGIEEECGEVVKLSPPVFALLE